MMRIRTLVASLCTAVTLGAYTLGLASVGDAADRWGLKEGTPELESAGPLAFGPDGILLVGDTKAATVFAIATGDTSGNPAAVNLNITGLNEQVATLLAANPEAITINDMAVNPLSGNVYLSVSKRAGESSSPALVRVDGSGKLTEVPVKNVAYVKATLSDAPEDKLVGEGQRRRNLRNESITDMAYVDGKVIVAGMSNAAAPSTVRELAFPFHETDQGTNVEIYHAAHGRYEDYAAVRALVPFNIDGEPNLLAGFTCTPLVKLPLSGLTPGEKVRGTTIAELGNRNQPLDMIVYEKDGKQFVLMANNNRGVMKISTAEIERQSGLSEPVRGGGTAGQSFETIESWEGVVQLDKLNATHAIVVMKDGEALALRTLPLP